MLCNLTTTCLFLLLVYLTILYKSSAACALMLLLALGILFGILHLFYTVSHVQIEFPEVVVESSQKGTGHLAIRIKNTGKLSVQQTSMKLYLKDSQQHIVSFIPVNFSIPHREASLVELEVSSHLCGRFYLETRLAKFYSPFHLVCFPYRKVLQCEALFYPEPFPLDIQVTEATRYFAAESEEFEDLVPGMALHPINEIREFLPGDRVRQIHWKLSARTDSLLVRDMGKPDGFPVLVFLQLQILHGQAAASSLSQFWEFAVSLSFALLESKCRHFVIWFDQKEGCLMRYPIRTEEDLTACIYTLLHEEFYDSSKELYDLYAKKYPGDTFHTRLILNTNMTLQQESEAPCTCTRDMTITV